ncbi:immunity 50 family protein [Erwinia pyrifoliae]|uniref:immunity 50 family protein n=1 Tax=Erwinia pyrifoliae TaxID=79967 RepID=UPI00223B9084|nr:immunity 50 family protein [Erwinia pyrifoliae]MCT2385939.1 immunity 50 family protein [Erwinia pyrifoliae]MCT2385947.1 immunity 50 family protein [Erwinia pyrifoliae]MCT2387910.1 immunity 50 family protein [Erwinia pyrifoliae]
MNIVELMENKFIHSLYPHGIKGNVLIGQLSLDIADQVMLSVHTSQTPDKVVAKWGVWGKDYNVIVINVLAQFISKVEINNWQSIKPSPLVIDIKESGIYSLTSKGIDWDITIDFKSLTFQRCDVYIK